MPKEIYKIILAFFCVFRYDNSRYTTGGNRSACVGEPTGSVLYLRKSRPPGQHVKVHDPDGFFAHKRIRNITAYGYMRLVQ